MNKILLLALLGFAFIALTAGDESEKSFAIDNPEQTELRGVRDAEPGRNRNKKSKGKGAKKGEKKGRSSAKKARRIKKQKKMKNAKSGKRSGRKIHRRTKQKKGGRKNNKAGKKSMRKKKKTSRRNKKNEKTNVRQTTCGDETCLANALLYIKQVKDKVTNYIKQKKRIEKFIKLSSNKGQKKADFKGTLSTLKENGGGNASALACQGSTSSEGAKQLQAMVAKLDACEANINTSCSAAPPTFDTAAAAACETTLTKFATAVDACIKLTGAAACTCWKDSALATQSASLKDCDISANNTEITKFKGTCIKAFADCRTAGSSASDIISACSPSNSAANLKIKLKAATENKNSLTKLQETVNAKAARRRSHRSIRAATCAVFISDVADVVKMANEAPDAPGLAKKADAVTQNAPNSCTAAEKESLKSVSAKITESITALDSFISSVQSTLQAQTGSTASSNDIQSAGTTAGATTAAVTTKAPGKRSRVVKL